MVVSEAYAVSEQKLPQAVQVIYGESSMRFASGTKLLLDANVELL
ncbi:MAG TPA: hypothetical protein VEI73_14755 [Candidatus Acidoferrum sp.]|nr:hypothetical protein [Candidatus Acidoferrum sp.]